MLHSRCHEIWQHQYEGFCHLKTFIFAEMWYSGDQMSE